MPFKERRHLATEYKLGEGLVGQCALEQERILLTDCASGLHQSYIRIGRIEALEHRGSAGAVEGQIKAVVELASFHRSAISIWRFSISSPKVSARC